MQFGFGRVRSVRIILLDLLDPDCSSIFIIIRYLFGGGGGCGVVGEFFSSLPCTSFTFLASFLHSCHSLTHILD